MPDCGWRTRPPEVQESVENITHTGLDIRQRVVTVRKMGHYEMLHGGFKWPALVNSAMDPRVPHTGGGKKTDKRLLASQEEMCSMEFITHMSN
jgi:hypothetical protein